MNAAASSVSPACAASRAASMVPTHGPRAGTRPSSITASTSSARPRPTPPPPPPAAHPLVATAETAPARGLGYPEAEQAELGQRAPLLLVQRRDRSLDAGLDELG